MRWNATHRLTLAIVAAIAGILLFFAGYRISQDYFENSGKVRERMQALLTDLYALDSEILRSSTFLYYNYDRIHRLTDSIGTNLKRLTEEPYLESNQYQGMRKELFQFRQKLQTFFDRIETFLTLNASLKNSAIYIPTLQLRAYRIFDPQKAVDRDTLILLSRINASIFLARDALDTDFIGDLKSYENVLREKLPYYSGAQSRLLSTLLSHLRQFIAVFPRYTRIMDHLTHNGLVRRLKHLNARFQLEAKSELTTINHITTILLILYLSSLVVVIYFIFKTERENRTLRLLKEQLEKSLVTDLLTDLRNRRAFETEKEGFEHPALILVNIDRFKQINELYGSSMGDRVLQMVARHLESLIPLEVESRLYRIGGDEYGILVENREGTDLRKMTCYFHEKLEGLQLEIDGLTIDLSFAIGGSGEKDRLFETADMALKQAKTSTRRQCEIYTPQIDKRLEIAQNIQTVRQIHEALEQNRLIPYYQPILHLKKDRITKYEALARIELDGENEVLEPSAFMHVANEAKLGGKITQRILEETLRTAEDHDYLFSVNFTATDINSGEERSRILRLLEAHPRSASRIIFELLESEEIEDYDTIDEFINQIKRYGCKVAIDDFGSGYSNYEKILKMNIDSLKIDGSLIRRIDHDRHSELIVRTILDFTRYAGIETVAEYVHSPSVFEKVRELGFDYAQGYFIGKPSPGLLPKNDFLPTE